MQRNSTKWFVNLPHSVFQFPSNGKGHAKRLISQLMFVIRRKKFQFPSNGKGHAKFKGIEYEDKFKDCFNSLQTGKGMQSVVGAPKPSMGISFNSLQTGKGMQREEEVVAENDETGFNSLQTGKGMQRRKLHMKSRIGIVSIPFKRERACKGRSEDC